MRPIRSSPSAQGHHGQRRDLAARRSAARQGVKVFDRMIETGRELATRSAAAGGRQPVAGDRGRSRTNPQSVAAHLCGDGGARHPRRQPGGAAAVLLSVSVPARAAARRPRRCAARSSITTICTTSSTRPGYQRRRVRPAVPRAAGARGAHPELRTPDSPTQRVGGDGARRASRRSRTRCRCSRSAPRPTRRKPARALRRARAARAAAGRRCAAGRVRGRAQVRRPGDQPALRRRPVGAGRRRAATARPART